MTTEWLRAQGLGRERLATYVAEYLRGRGYAVEIIEDGGTSRLSAHVERPHPSVPPALADLRFSLVPSAGGSILSWDAPETVPSSELPRADRLAHELEQHLIRIASTQSHGVARLRPSLNAAAPWRRPRPDAPSASPREIL